MDYSYLFNLPAFCWAVINCINSLIVFALPSDLKRREVICHDELQQLSFECPKAWRFLWNSLATGNDISLYQCRRRPLDVSLFLLARQFDKSATNLFWQHNWSL